MGWNTSLEQSVAQSVWWQMKHLAGQQELSSGPSGQVDMSMSRYSQESLQGTKTLGPLVPSVSRP